MAHSCYCEVAITADSQWAAILTYLLCLQLQPPLLAELFSYSFNPVDIITKYQGYMQCGSGYTQGVCSANDLVSKNSLTVNKHVRNNTPYQIKFCAASCLRTSLEHAAVALYLACWAPSLSTLVAAEIVLHQIVQLRQSHQCKIWARSLAAQKLWSYCAETLLQPATWDGVLCMGVNSMHDTLATHYSREPATAQKSAVILHVSSANISFSYAASLPL